MNAALMLVDVQQAFDDPRWGSRNNPRAETNIARLLARWRETKRPVVHVHHDSNSPAGFFWPGTIGNAPKAEAQPEEGESVYHKQVNSAFIGTTIEADLRVRGIETLVIVGLTTQHCVSTTTRMAGNLGFRTYLVSDATATFDQVGIDGSHRPAIEVHIGALGDLQDEFATIIDTETLLEACGTEQTVEAAFHPLPHQIV